MSINKNKFFYPSLTSIFLLKYCSCLMQFRWCAVNGEGGEMAKMADMSLLAPGPIVADDACGKRQKQGHGIMDGS